MQNDKQSAVNLQQAINDDQALVEGAASIKVSVKDGTVTLDGHVSSQKQMDLATNTVVAVSGASKIDNRMLIRHTQKRFVAAFMNPR